MEKKQTVSVLMKPSSGMCNMECAYCFYCDEMQKRKQESYGFMSEETLKNTIRKTLLPTEKAVCYAYQGGEPTLRGIDFFRKAVAFQKQYNKNHAVVQNAFQTNGYALNEEWCHFFKENNFLVGVSLDGIAQVHDQYRRDKAGNATFSRIEYGIHLLEKYQVDFNILTVVTKDTVEHIEEIYAYYRKKNWNYQQYIACLDPIGEKRGLRRYALTPEVYGEFLIRLFDLWYRDWEKGAAPYIRQFENYVGILAGYCPEACDQRGSCGIQNVVEADGSVYPCDFYMMDEYRLGNFSTDRLEQMDQKRKEIQFVERSLLLEEKCRECRYFYLCRGGCQRHREHQEGTAEYQNYFCKGFRMFFEVCEERLKTVALKDKESR